MKKILSISIAAYNVENFICETLDSLIIPEIIDKLEIFVVDDGGTDKTTELAKEYQKLYPDSIKIVNKENGGYGSTVNYSIQHATGKYFKLLDGDDWYVKEGLKNLVDKLEETDADVVVNSMFKGSDKDNLKEVKTWKYEADRVYSIGKDHIEVPLAMWVLTYKTSRLKESNLSLPLHRLYTDQLYCTIPFAYMNTIQYFDFSVYCYRVGRQEQSVSVPSKVKHINNELDVCEDIVKFCASQKLNKNYKYILYRSATYYRNTYMALLLLPICKNSMIRIKKYEEKICNISPEIIEKASNIGKKGLLIKLIRKSKYILYWLLVLVPKERLNEV